MASDLMPGSRLFTEDHPEEGCVVVVGVVLSEGERWVTADGHTIRGTEFEVFAEGASLQDAVSAFAVNWLDLYRVLLGLTDDRVTEREREAREKMERRLLEISDRFDEMLASEEKRPLIKVNWPWQETRRTKAWKPRSKHGNYSQPLTA